MFGLPVAVHLSPLAEMHFVFATGHPEGCTLFIRRRYRPPQGTSSGPWQESGVSHTWVRPLWLYEASSGVSGVNQRWLFSHPNDLARVLVYAAVDVVYRLDGGPGTPSLLPVMKTAHEVLTLPDKPVYQDLVTRWYQALGLPTEPVNWYDGTRGYPALLVPLAAPYYQVFVRWPQEADKNRQTFLHAVETYLEAWGLRERVRGLHGRPLDDRPLEERVRPRGERPRFFSARTPEGPCRLLPIHPPAPSLRRDDGKHGLPLLCYHRRWYLVEETKGEDEEGEGGIKE